MAKRDFITTRNKSAGMTVKELKKEIRLLTLDVNERLNETIAAGKTSKMLTKEIERLQQLSAYRAKGRVHIPHGRSGPVGLGLAYKSKEELIRQYEGLARFSAHDIATMQGERIWSERGEKAYQTFKKRYGEISRDDYEEMWSTFESVKDILNLYGYEDSNIGGSLARMYTKSDHEGKRKFASYVMQAKRNLGEGGTAKALLDGVAELLREDGAI